MYVEVHNYFTNLVSDLCVDSTKTRPERACKTDGDVEDGICLGVSGVQHRTSRRELMEVRNGFKIIDGRKI